MITLVYLKYNELNHFLTSNTTFKLYFIDYRRWKNKIRALRRVFKSTALINHAVKLCFLRTDVSKLNYCLRR